MFFKKKETKNIFHTTEKEFKKYFDKTKSNHEKNKEQLLLNLLNDFFSKVYKESQSFIEKDYPYIGYTEHYGYYALTKTGHNLFTLVEGFPCQNIDDAFYLIIEDYLWSHGIDFEYNNREKLKKDYNKRFHNSNYNDVMYFCEYALDKWNKFYGKNIPENIINYYEKYLNNLWISSKENIKWEYDQRKHLFSCVALS